MAHPFVLLRPSLSTIIPNMAEGHQLMAVNQLSLEMVRLHVSVNSSYPDKGHVLKIAEKDPKRCPE